MISEGNVQVGIEYHGELADESELELQRGILDQKTKVRLQVATYCFPFRMRTEGIRLCEKRHSYINNLGIGLFTLDLVLDKSDEVLSITAVACSRCSQRCRAASKINCAKFLGKGQVDRDDSSCYSCMVTYHM